MPTVCVAPFPTTLLLHTPIIVPLYVLMASRHNSPPYQPHPGYGPPSPPSPPVPQYFEGHYGHRLSNKGGPNSPEIHSPGLESVMADEGDKEVAPQHWSKPEPMPQTWHQQSGRREARNGRTVCGLPLFWFCILVAAIVAIGVGLGVGLGIGLSNDECVESASALRILLTRRSQLIEQCGGAYAIRTSSAASTAGTASKLTVPHWRCDQSVILQHEWRIQWLGYRIGIAVICRGWRRRHARLAGPVLSAPHRRHQICAAERRRRLAGWFELRGCGRRCEEQHSIISRGVLGAGSQLLAHLL